MPKPTTQPTHVSSTSSSALSRQPKQIPEDFTPLNERWYICALCFCQFPFSLQLSRGRRKLRSPGQRPCLDTGWEEAHGSASACAWLPQAGPHLEPGMSVRVSAANQASGILIGDCLLVDLHGRLTARSSPPPARDFQEQCLQASVAHPGQEPSLPLPSRIGHVDLTHTSSPKPCQEQSERCLYEVGWVTSGAGNSPESLWNPCASVASSHYHSPGGHMSPHCSGESQHQVHPSSSTTH